MYKNLILILITTCCFTLFVLFPAWAEETLSSCSIYEAEYKPHPDYHSEKGKLDFVMTVAKPAPGEGAGSSRSIFFYFDAYDVASSRKLSTLRLGDACSNGIVVCGLSAFWGQFSSIDAMMDFKTVIKFDALALNRNFKRISYTGPEAPYAYIFTDTMGEFFYEKNGQSKENIDKYVKFYTDEKVLPFFGGYDVWILNRCQNNQP